MINLAILFKRSSLAAGSIFSFTMLMVIPCHGNKEASSGDFKVGPEMTKMLYANCYSCHDEWEQKGDIRLDQLETLPLVARLDLMNKMQEKIHLKEMPPKDEEEQPTEAERKGMFDWLSAELKKHNASKLEAKLSRPEFGNYMDHEKLFSGQYKDLKGFTSDRRWLISEFIFDNKINKLLGSKYRRGINGQATAVSGAPSTLTNPFLLAEKSGVRYYASDPLNESHFSTMVSNAKPLADKLLAVDRRGLTGFASINKVMQEEFAFMLAIKTRKEFLESYMEKVCEDIYGSKNIGLLPKFTPLIIDLPEKSPAAHQLKPRSSEDMNVLLTILNKHSKEKNLQKMVKACQKDWFYRDLSAVKIQNFSYYILLHYKHIIKGNQYKRAKPRPYKALAQAEMEEIKKTISSVRSKGDFFPDILNKCSQKWASELAAYRKSKGLPAKADLIGVIKELHVKILEREPIAREYDEYVSLLESYIPQMGRVEAINLFTQTLFLNTEFVYRHEFGSGKADDHGRKMLSSRNAAYAISYALTDGSPDKELMAAANEGRLESQKDYQREVSRLLKKRDQYNVIDKTLASKSRAVNATNLPIRKLRFFREFFGYAKMLSIFKDDKRFGTTQAKDRLLAETDMIVEHILKKDKNVFEELLLSDKFYVFHSGNDKEMQKGVDQLNKFYNYFKAMDHQKMTSQDQEKHLPFLRKNPYPGFSEKMLHRKSRFNPERAFRGFMADLSKRASKNPKNISPFSLSNKYQYVSVRSPQVANYFGIDFTIWDYPVQQPTKMPNRKGILTHPAWLMSFAQNTETDPVIRGKWIREKLLAGTIPDIPITVDAVVPEDAHKTLKQRLVKTTEKKYCWKCHVSMNPLGYPFESFDDFGRFRTEESLEYPENLVKKSPDKGHNTRDIFKTLPIDSKGYLAGTGDKALDGEVKDAFDLIERLGKSRKVRQSIIRHAFRYFMGRNEMLSDSKTLIDAEQAYLKNSGSFDAVIISLLSSDSFIYRKVTKVQ